MGAASAEQNEQNVVTVRGDAGTVVFKQIAGLLARRIVFTRKVGDRVERGERVGLIKFGSRTDVIFAADAEMKVRVGDRVKGGSSVLAVAQPRPGGAAPARYGGGAMNPRAHDRAIRMSTRRRGVRKGLYILPSMFTAGNMAAGLLRDFAGHSGHGRAIPGTSIWRPRPLDLPSSSISSTAASRA